MATTMGRVSDFDLRYVRFFTVVAEHGNIGRAAAELRIAQPTLSRYVQRLEKAVGVPLFDRTPQGTRLTEAGRVFLVHATTLLATAQRAAAEARATVAGGSITVGYVGSLIVTPAVSRLRAEHPEADVRTAHLHWSEVASALRNGEVDAVVARTPFDVTGLRTTFLYSEPRVLLVPVGHRLAGRASVRVEDFGDEPLVRYPDPDYDAFWRGEPRPAGFPAPDGPLADRHHDKLESVAAGDALALAPARAAARPDIRGVPVEGIAWSTVVLATRDGDRNALVDDVVRLAPGLLAN